MIIEIEKPSFILDKEKNEKYFKNTENNEIFCNTSYKKEIYGEIKEIEMNIFYNENGEHYKVDWIKSPWDIKTSYYKNKVLHRDDGPCMITNNNEFILKGKTCSSIEFAYKTKHLICESCDNFCKQSCFLI